MTQLQFELICKVIESGAPALANELCDSLDALVKERNAFAEKLDKLKKPASKPKANN